MQTLITLGDGERRAPVALEDIQADASLGVNVAVVDLGLELELGRLEGVIVREGNVQEEDAYKEHIQSGWVDQDSHSCM